MRSPKSHVPGPRSRRILFSASSGAHPRGSPWAVRLTALCVLLCLTACRPFAPRSTDPVAQEQEIVRDVKWRLSKDTRFDEVLVSCAGRIVTLAGRVSNAQAAQDAQAIAAAVRDVERVDNRIDVKAK